MLFIPTEQSLSEFVVLSVTCLVALATGNRLTIPRWAWVAGGALCAALLLVKVSTGSVLLAVLMISAVVQRRREAVALLMSSFIAWVLVLWVLLGQSLTDLPGWLRGAVEIAFGHTSAMSIGTPGGAWQYGVLAVVLGTAAMAIGPEVLRIWRSDRQAGLHAIAAVLIVALLAWFFVKQGFVRRDGHAAVFFAGAVIATAVLTAWQRLGRVHLVLLSTSCMLALVGCLVIDIRVNVDRLSPHRPLIDVASSVELVVSVSARSDELLSANEDARSEYEVPQRMLDAIGAAPVHVDPHEVTLAWAYGLNWQPISPMQRYIGYTVWLDQRNADELIGDEAPEFVLHAPQGAIVSGRRRDAIPRAPSRLVAWNREMSSSFRLPDRTGPCSCRSSMRSRLGRSSPHCC
jgi:hypothetical protein